MKTLKWTELKQAHYDYIKEAIDFPMAKFIDSDDAPDVIQYRIVDTLKSNELVRTLHKREEKVSWILYLWLILKGLSESEIIDRLFYH